MELDNLGNLGGLLAAAGGWAWMDLDLLVRLLAAAGLGALVGLERDVHGRAAGLRTHLLVSLGAAGFMILSELVAAMPAGRMTGGFFSDPGRIAAQIVTGIGFLGAGAIIKEGVSVRGLTTAACLWVVASVGMACGAARYDVGISITLISLAGLIVLKQAERIYPRDHYRILTIETASDIELAVLVRLVETDGIRVVFVGYQRDYEKGVSTFTLSLRVFQSALIDVWAQKIAARLEQEGVPLTNIRWNHR